MTSLASQLKKLAAPQTDLLKADKRKASILFDPREAANISRDELHQLGVSGLQELERLDSRFSEFHQTLYSPSSVSFERAVQTKEANAQVDERIRKFLILVSPYFTLRAAHKAVEWLVARYHVHRYNTEDWVACILPFHDTKIFVRAVQVLELGNEHDRWYWLKSLQKPGVPLTKNILLNRCCKDMGFMKFVCSMPLKFLAVHASKKEALKTSTAFFTTAIIGMVEYLGKVEEEQLSVLLPTVFECFASKIPELIAGCYMIVAQLARKAKLVDKATEEIVHHILKNLIPELVPEAVTLLVVLYGTQSLKTVPKYGIKNLLKSGDRVMAAAGSLAATYRVSSFLVPLIESLLKELGREGAAGQHGDRSASFLVAVVDEIAFVGDDREDVIRAFVSGYLKSLSGEQGTSERIRGTVKNALERLEKRYPDCFERSVHLELSSEADNERWKVEIRQLLGIGWETEETTLFLKLNHSSTDVRAAAVQSMVAAVVAGQVRNPSFTVSTLTERLVDSSPTVVEEVLRLEDKLLELIPAEQQFPLLLKSLALGPGQSGDWETVRVGLMNLMCSRQFVQSLSDEQKIDLFLAILPFTMPVRRRNSKVLEAAATSHFGYQSPMLSAVVDKIAEIQNLPPNDYTVPDRVYSVMEQFAPFAVADMNVRLLERILEDLGRPVTRPIQSLMEALIAPPLLRNVTDPALKSRMARTFIDRLISLSRIAQVRKCLETTELRIQPFVSRAVEGDIQLEALLFCAMQVFEDFQFDWSKLAKRQWSRLSAEDPTDAGLLFFLSLYGLLVTGLASRSALLFQKCLQRFFDKMGELNSQVFFLSLVWNDAETFGDAMKIVALKMAAAHIRESPVSLGWAVDFQSFVVPQLLAALTSPNADLRRAVFGVFQVLGSSLTTRLASRSYAQLIESLNQCREEVEVDADQLKFVLGKILTQKSSAGACTALFNLLTSTEVPERVQRGLSLALGRVNTTAVLTSLLPVIDRLLERGVKDGRGFGPAASVVLSTLLERFTSQTASVLGTVGGWNTFQKALTTADAFIDASSDHLTLAPQDIVIEVVTKDLARALPNSTVHYQIYRQLLDIVIGTEKTVTARQARRALKRITYDASLLVKHLEFQNQAAEPTGTQGTGRATRRSRQQPINPSQSPNWNGILAILEILQSKKEIDKVELLIAPLFHLLKSCVNEEEQVSLEYSKQIILSCLLSCCQKLPPGDSNKLAAEFNTGLIVQCIRVSNNPQTHHQALLLLSLAAQLFPSHVLHNIMAIFTFMGTSVLRQDDAYSFQVIAKTLESVVPTLIEASMSTAVEPVVTTVIHVFADALPEVPEHRRIAIFDKLLSTLNPEVYLWLAPTLILSNMATQGPKLAGRGQPKGAEEAESAGRERLTADVEFALNVCHLYKPQVQLRACIRIVEYLQSLPVERDERRAPPRGAQAKDMTEGSAPFALEVHTTRQLCHFKLLLVNFISTLLSSKRLIEQLLELDDEEKTSLELLYQRLIEVGLQYTQSIARVMDQPGAAELAPNPKFWRFLLHRCYDVIDRINSLLPRSMFISVVQALLAHGIPSIRRRAMELLSAKLQHQSNFFSLPEDEGSLIQLIAPLTSIAAGQNSQQGEEEALNQQTAFFTLKLLCRLLGPSASPAFKPTMEVVVDIISPKTNSPTPILASALLCLAELIQNMAVSSLPYLPKYGANLVARLEDVKAIEHHDLLLLSIVTAVGKLVETLPQFLVPYLSPILKQVCYLSTRHPSTPERTGPLQSRLQAIRHSLATSSSPRSLVTSAVQVYEQVTAIDSGRFDASPSIGPLMSILSDSFTSMSRSDLVLQLPALTSFFMKAMDARSMLSAQEAGTEEMNLAEGPVVTALVALVLKLSEASFRPLFFQLYDWATQTDCRKERLVTFYNVTMQIAEKLKGLFVLFAGHFLANAAQVLVETNAATQKDSLPFCGPHAQENTLMLLEYVLRCLYRICLHDNENFINKERFEMLLEPLVDQLENRLGPEQVVERRVQDLLVPLLAQMAVAASDDYLWKSLHYQLLLKTRNNSPHVRLASMSALSALVEKLGEDYLALLPEAIPFLAELLEDDVQEVEVAAQTTIQNFENVLGENLQKYF